MMELTEAADPDKIIAVAATDGFRYLGIQPGLSFDELKTFPTLYGSGATIENGVNSIEGHRDGSMSIGFDTERVPALRKDAEFLRYAEYVAKLIGYTTLHQDEVLYIGPGSIVGQVNSGTESTFGDQTFRMSGYPSNSDL